MLMRFAVMPESVHMVLNSRKLFFKIPYRYNAAYFSGDTAAISNLEKGHFCYNDSKYILSES
jgi:hypothetical protein